MALIQWRFAASRQFNVWIWSATTTNHLIHRSFCFPLKINEQKISAAQMRQRERNSHWLDSMGTIVVPCKRLAAQQNKIKLPTGAFCSWKRKLYHCSKYFPYLRIIIFTSLLFRFDTLFLDTLYSRFAHTFRTEI